MSINTTNNTNNNNLFASINTANNNNNNSSPFSNISNNNSNQNPFSTINNNNSNNNNSIFSFNNGRIFLNNNSSNIFNNNNSNINNLFSNSNIFGNNNKYEDNSKYINLGNEWNFSKNETDYFNDPFNEKWYKDNDEDNEIYDKNEYNILTQRVKKYCENNQGRKNYLEYCDKNSETLKTIRNMNLSFEDDDF